MEEETVELSHHLAFEQEGRKRLIVLLIAVASLAGLLGSFIFLQFVTAPSNRYFPLNENGQFLQEVPLDQPNMSTHLLLNWVVEHSMDLYSFNFINADQHIKKMQNIFTPQGYKGYLEVLKSTHETDYIRSNRFVLSSEVRAAPSVLEEGVRGGVYFWIVNIPLTLFYHAVGSNIPRNIDMRLVVVRVPNQDSLYGLGVVRFETPNNARDNNQALTLPPPVIQ
jgi:hypothetical protein